MANRKGEICSMFGEQMLSFKKRDYNINIQSKLQKDLIAEIDVNITNNDSVDQYSLSNIEIKWSQFHWGYMLYPKNTKELFDALNVFKLRYHKRQILEFLS